MNKVILMGRLTRDPEIRYSQGEHQTAIARYTLAVNRAFKRQGEPDADFINCIAFGRAAEFAEKYLRKGIRLVITGRIQTGSYVNREGVKVYTTDIVVEDQEFAESKAASDRNAGEAQAQGRPEPASASAGGYPEPAPESAVEGFMSIPEGIEDELPFS